MLVLVLIGVGAGVVVGGVGDADAGVALVLVVFLSCFGDGSAGLGGAVRVCVVHLLRLMNVGAVVALVGVAAVTHFKPRTGR